MEELEVLKAIYGNDLNVSGGDDGGYLLKLEIEIEESSSLLFYLSDGFPQVKPKVTFITTRKGAELVEQLVIKSMSSEEDNYLYDAIEVARNWALQHTDENAKQQLTEERAVCKFFINGKCRFGDNCINKHPTNADKKSGQNMTRNTSTTSAATRIRNSEDCLNKEEEIDDKKKRSMKTATDVISRILWDDGLPTEDFSVGYLDRFIGIVEKPFSSFSWEDIASVDYSTLAIPKHRIQYFKYKDIIVWDKGARMDKIFGSTGHKKEIYEIIKSQEDLQVTSDCVAKENEEQLVDEQVNSSDDEDDDQDGNIDVDAQIDNEEKRWNHSNKPNFFFCFKITEDAIKEKILEVQQEIVSCNPPLRKGCLKQTEFHVTLCMLRLISEEEKKAAMKVLESMQPILVCMLPNTHKLLYQSLGNFRGRLLHAEVASDPNLSKFVKILLLKLKDAGLHPCGNREPYCPHVTILKLSRPICRNLAIKQIDPNYYQHRLQERFGEQNINEIFLCSTGKARNEEGFYLQLASKPNSLFCISEKLPNAIAKYLNLMVEESVFTEEEGDELLQALLSNDETQFEKAVCHLKTLFDQRDELKLKDRNVFILRGLQGSGKSYLVTKCKENVVIGKADGIGEDASAVEYQGCDFITCSADDFFEQGMSGYSFNANQLANAHLQCQRKFIDAICNDVSTIVIDNTNSQTWEYRIYERIAKLCGYSSYVIEIACKDEQTLMKFLERSQHKVDKESVMRTWNRWETDNNAIVIEPEFGNDANSTSLLELTRNKSQPLFQVTEVLFSGLFLDNESRKRLLEEFPPLHSRVAANHMTFAYKPMKEEIPQIPVGKQHSVTVVGYVHTDLMQAVAVKEEKDVYCSMEVPHITIAHSKKAAPQHAKLAFANKAAWQLPSKELIISGTIGVQVAVGRKNSVVVTDGEIFRDVCRQIHNSNSSADIIGKKKHGQDLNQKEDGQKPDEAPSLYFGPEEIKSLFVFDFDGTLFNTPDPVIGRRQYRELTGENWPHNSWIGKAESLQWPLRSQPGPSFLDFKKHIGRACSLTILLTGRLERTAVGVNEVIREYGIHPDRCYLKPDDGLAKVNRAIAQVASFKTDVIRRLLKEHPAIERVKIWDDRQDNVDAFRRMRKEYKNVAFEVYKVGDEDKKHDRHMKGGFDDKDIQKMIDDFGFGTSSSFDSAVEQGISFLTNAWCSCIDTYPKENIVRQFGSFPLKRVGDVDICILVPCALNPDECILKLENAVIQRGVKHVHAATGIRCPRLKLRILYENVGPIEFDVVFAPCLTDNKLPVNLSQLFENGNSDVKAALEGVLFLEKVENCIRGSISLHDFGILVDLIVHYLKTKHLKGNAFHCFRTFHIVRALAEMFHKMKDSVIGLSNQIRSCFEHLCCLDVDYWSRICKDTVPEEMIERTVESFVSAVRMLNQSEQCAKIFAFSKFPPVNHTVISIKVKSPVSELRWRAHTFVEAKLGGYLRKLLAVGIDIVPGPCDSKNTFMFATPSNERNIKDIKTVILNLKSEPIFQHNRKDLDLVLHTDDF